MLKWAGWCLTRRPSGPLCRCSSLLNFLFPASSGETVSSVSLEDGCGAEVSLSDSKLFSLRPLTVSTEDYGKMWLDFSHDTKQNLKLVGDSLADTLNMLTSKLQLHVVEIIGNPTSQVNPSKVLTGC